MFLSFPCTPPGTPLSQALQMAYCKCLSREQRATKQLHKPQIGEFNAPSVRCPLLDKFMERVVTDRTIWRAIYKASSSGHQTNLSKRNTFNTVDRKKCDFVLIFLKSIL